MRTLTLATLCWFTSAATVCIGQDADDWDSPNAIRPESGRIDIKDQVEISAEIPGKITELNPSSRGGHVKKGEIVVRLKSDLINAQLKELD